jgi:hypothetical protein
MTTFQEFRDNVLKAVRSRDFGAERYSNRDAQSPAAKELERTSAYGLFTETFIRSLHRLFREHSRQVGERPKVKTLRSTNVPKLVKLRNAQNSIQALRARIGQLEKNTVGLIAPEVWAPVMEALANAESEVRKRQQFLSAMLHQADRKPPALQKVGWEHVLNSHKYVLTTLEAKAPDEWLYETLNRSLMETLQRLNLSAITRYRIITALFEAFGLQPVRPTTLKLYFQEKAAAQKSRVNATQAPVKKS